uniref:NADH-ubiquinone oxidoreductase chain 4 n=1 Tax=Microbotryum lychnidis-dioicae TaxID=288795 RepID=M1GLC5_9BASI|nr:NADH dehydrogenase subunit 4 [Microbotryum lychnidis-dioicae]AGE14583.1 NADH dehydrogenase subunit 4 [Microbotryum lychnidis-dioicae]
MLTSLILIPLLGAVILFPMNDSTAVEVSRVKRVALLATVITFILSMILWAEFDSSSSSFQFTQSFTSLNFAKSLDVPKGPALLQNKTWVLGVDGLSLYFVLLTTFTLPLCLLASWDTIKHNIKSFMIAFLVLESLLICVFVVLDLLLFYVFFESVLIPLFLIIGIWGASADRVRASFLLFLYTLFGSLFMLLAFLVIFYHVGSTDFEVLSLADISFNHQRWLWLAIFMSLAIKTPLLPVHIWLSRAHVQADVSTSMVLAGLILKLATYGYIRVLIPLLPEATSYFSPLVQTLCVVTLVYSSLTILRQTDFKVLIAYSSVAHMSVVVIGLFSDTLQGIEGAILLSIGHGFVSPALFYCLGGVLYNRYHTRQIRYYRGLIQYMPIFSLVFFLFILGNMSTPLTINWIGEFLSLTGAVQRNAVVGFAMSSGIVFSAAYSIWLYARLAGGQFSPYLGYATDLTRREFMVLLPFVFSMFLFGLFPNIILTDLHYSVSTLLTSPAPFLSLDLSPFLFPLFFT